MIALLLGVGAALRVVDLLVAVAIVQGLLVVSWALTFGPPVLEPSPIDLPPRLTRLPSSMPGRIGAVLIGGAAAAGADVAVSVRPHAALGPLLIVLGLAVPLMFAHQLTRGVVGVRVVASLSGVSVLVVSVVALTALVQLRHEDDGARRAVAAVAAAGTAVVVGYLVDLVWSRPRFDPDVPRGLMAVGLATVAGTAAGVAALNSSANFTTTQATLFAAVIALVAALTAVSVAMIAHGVAVGTVVAVDGQAAVSTGSHAGTGVTGSIDVPVDRPDAAAVLRPIAVAVVPLALVSPVSYLLLLMR